MWAPWERHDLGPGSPLTLGPSLKGLTPESCDSNLSQLLPWRKDLTKAVISRAFVVGKDQSTQKYVSKGFGRVLTLPQQWAVELWTGGLMKSLG